MTQSAEQLKVLVDSISDGPYQKIQKLRGVFQFPQFSFKFKRIQRSPGANPASIATVSVDIKTCNIPAEFFNTTLNRFALADFLIRRFNEGIGKFARQNRGRDGSGSFHTIVLGQKMMRRDSILLNNEQIECCFIFSLPAKGSGGGRFDADQAWAMFEDELTAIVDYTFYYSSYHQAEKELLAEYLCIQNTRQQIKHYMEQHGLVVFINNGAHLPRENGVSDEPASGIEIIKFQSPELAYVEIPLAENTSIKGMAVKAGVSCITGGGYHGKSTMLQAILSGVYAHIPGDGREYIVTREDAVFIRAEEGRSIRNVDISPFIGQLPNGKKTEHFSSDNASGSTSQAAAIVEAIECNSRLLLFDEDTCASNFLFRDELINKVLNSNNEPIKPLYSSIRTLWQQKGISMIFVIGGLGRFLQKADVCLLMDNYQCKEISVIVREKLGAIVNDTIEQGSITHARYLEVDNFNPSYTNQRLKKQTAKRIKVLRNAARQLEYGMDLINLEAIPQIAETPQLLGIGYCLLFIRKAMMEQGNEVQTIDYWLQWLFDKLERQGLSVLKPDYPGTLSLPRKYEVAAAINRIRSLNVK